MQKYIDLNENKPGRELPNLFTGRSMSDMFLNLFCVVKIGDPI